MLILNLLNKSLPMIQHPQATQRNDRWWTIQIEEGRPGKILRQRRRTSLVLAADPAAIPFRSMQISQIYMQIISPNKFIHHLLGQYQTTRSSELLDALKRAREKAEGQSNKIETSVKDKAVNATGKKIAKNQLKSIKIQSIQLKIRSRLTWRRTFQLGNIARPNPQAKTQFGQIENVHFQFKIFENLLKN